MDPAPQARTEPTPNRPVSAPPPADGGSGVAGEPGESTLPRSGDVLEVTRQASVQFATPMLFRVIRVLDLPTYTGWVWLDGYQLNAAGEAVERRSIFVQASGLRRVHAPGGRPRPGRK